MFSPFIEAVFQVLPGLGIREVQRGRLTLKEKLQAANDVTALVGLSRDLRGNMAISMSEETARRIVSIMMMGRPVAALDDMAQSALAELANMLASSALPIFEQNGLAVGVSPPTLITGRNLFCIVSQVQALAVEILMEAGAIEICIGLEV
jgi:chemotaxis protein CheX